MSEAADSKPKPAPKAAAAAPAPSVNKTVFLGRPGASLKMGIVGLPNVGKSTFFNVLSKKGVPAENRPFCTIEPNTADINIPDPRFDKLCKVHKPASIVPAQLHIRDIAGLVRGASAGEGLGNAFLSHIAEVDGIFHMCRAFESEDIVHIEGDIDPVRDLEIIFEEILAKDLQFVQNQIDKLEPVIKRNMDKTKKGDYDMLHVFKAHLAGGNQIRVPPPNGWNAKEMEFLETLQLLSAKPAVFLVNISERDYIRQRNPWLMKIKKWIDERTGEPLVIVSAELETNLLKMSDKEQEAWLNEHKTKSCIQKLISTGFNAINLQYFFTAGSDEVKCWTVQKGWKAPQAAGRIHTDMERGFICAEIMHWDDWDKLESESACRDEGKYHQMGKTYDVQDGDIIFFKFNPKGGKK